MQIVIDIPQDVYVEIKQELDMFGSLSNWSQKLLTYPIDEATVLSKSHGRLIDADKLFEEVGNIKPQNEEHYKAIGEFMNMITNSPTILKQAER